MNVTILDNDVFTVHNVFTPQECQDLIASAEAQGFEAASVTTPSGPKMMPGVRNNDRVVFDDPALAAQVWERVKQYVPLEMEGYSAVGLNERFRYYRYDPGQRFKRHQDGRVTLETGQVSRLTLLIYLNTGYEGGETVFRDYTTVDGQTVKQEISVSGETGMCLFFVHERKHEGAMLVEGRKYILRTDVMYAGAPFVEAAGDA